MNCAGERRALAAELSAKGVRMTSQRRALIDVIQDARQHLDASTLLEQARKREPNIDRATVYRTLELLKKFRLIDELDLMHLDGEKHFYKVRTQSDQVHLACFECARIEEFSAPILEHLKSEISKQTGFAIAVARLEVGGYCRACARAQAESKEGAKQSRR